MRAYDSPVAVISEKKCALSAEQAWAQYQLMFADVIAQSESILRKWAEDLPLYENEPEEARQREMLAQCKRSMLAQNYVRDYGKLDVPLQSLGSDAETMNQTFKQLILRIAKEPV